MRGKILTQIMVAFTRLSFLSRIMRNWKAERVIPSNGYHAKWNWKNLFQTGVTELCSVY